MCVRSCFLGLLTSLLLQLWYVTHIPSCHPRPHHPQSIPAETQTPAHATVPPARSVGLGHRLGGQAFAILRCAHGASAAGAGTDSFVVNSSAVSGVENMPKVPPVAAFWPSAEVVAQQSVTVSTLKPFSHAVRIVDSTQQLVRKPHSVTVSMPSLTRVASRSVFGNASRPFFPETTKSPSMGFIASQNCAFQVPSVKSLSLAHPARMPRALLGLSDASSLNMIGIWYTLPPASRIAAASAVVLASMSVLSITSLTAGNS